MVGLMQLELAILPSPTLGASQRLMLLKVASREERLCLCRKGKQ